MTAPAVAQDAGPYAPIGMRMGGFRLFPTLDVTANYDNNIYRTQTATRDDYYFLENPGFTLQSQWGRHQLDLFGAFNAYQYASLTSENHNDWNIGGNGRLDVVRGIDLAGGGSYGVLHEARTSPDQPGFAKTPTEFAMSQANAVLEYHPYHFGFSVGGTYARYDYNPTTLIGLPSLNNADRNRDEYVGYAKGSYEFSPGYAMFVQGNYRDVGYDLLIDRNGARRANNGYSVNAGLEMLVTDIVKGQIFVGYLDQHYHAPLVNVKGFNFGANVDWSASPLWTFHLAASRTLNGTTIAGASAEDDRMVRLGVDYSILRNVMIQAHFSYNDSVFNGSPREDKYPEAGIGVNYLMNSLMTATLAYAHQERNSSISGQGFTDNTVSVGLNFHL
ncbi:MAG: outer membrane beta-barrel protein [Alphaproteobacteria bacterium]|nr:outer membrane beta-barrel protein [Alphaproteobacteria bacterium]MDE2495275.1 outer membrane beta-barrel protein [Alphaproteobacteria bacterium]